MHSTPSAFRALSLAVFACAAIGVAGCTLDNQNVPSLSGPSEFALSLGLTATPDVLNRDGVSTATIRVTARDDKGKPLSGQFFKLGASTGALSRTEITTGADGTAVFEFTAPSRDTAVTSATVYATPVGTNFDNSQTRNVFIALAGPAIPAAKFTFTPAAPKQFEPVLFDASGTTLNGAACGALCTYRWNFGDGTTGTGQIINHTFTQQTSYSVLLTVTAPGEVTSTTSQTITILATAPITAAITISPTNPKVGDTVIFDGRDSTAPNGASIVSYEWDFGNGSTASGATATTTFPTAATYTVRLIITDSFGRTGTKTVPVSVTAVVP